ncbi:MAG: dihydrolipoyllysine-residue acetyltransferase [Porticoccus sp.]|nr:dihydrolipoyllysine-residue acetyltransferase [Porticoccus sp.]
MTTDIIHVPDLGGAETVEVIELCVAPGDTVELEQSLIVLESDKATMDVPSPKAGIVKALIVKEGDTVSEGSAILELEAELEAELEPVVEVAPVSEPESESSPAVTEPEDDTEPGSKITPEPVGSVAESARSEQIVGVPDIGTSDPVEVIEVLVSAGDTLAEGDSFIVVEGDKATMDIPAPFDGEVLEVLVKEGDKVTIGDNLARVMGAGVPMEVPGGAPVESAPIVEATVTSVEPASGSVAPPQEPEVSHVTHSDEADVYAGPASRALARELGVDLHKVAGTGPRGRILKEDLQGYVKKAVATAESGQGVGAGTGLGSGIPTVPDVDFKKFGEVEMIPLKKIQKLTAANMQRSWLNVPHVTQFDEADITDLEDFRSSLKPEAEKRGARLTPLPFMLKACAHALLANPEFNRSITSDGENFVQKKYIHIGVAVDTPRGLVVPVIRDVDTKGLWQLAIEVNDMASKARDGKLSPAEMQGGCFTISSLGAIGGNGFTPIVNTPEVGILGVSKSQIKPVWSGSEFLPRMMLPLSVSYDHRVVNGADCGRFFTYLVKELGDTRRLAL